MYRTQLCVCPPCAGGVSGFGFANRTYLRGAISHADPMVSPWHSTMSARRRARCPHAAGYVAHTPRSALSAPQSTLPARRAIRRLRPAEGRLVAASKIMHVQSAVSRQTRNPTKLNPNCPGWAELVYASGPGRSPPREDVQWKKLATRSVSGPRLQPAWSISWAAADYTS